MFIDAKGGHKVTLVLLIQTSKGVVTMDLLISREGVAGQLPDAVAGSRIPVCLRATDGSDDATARVRMMTVRPIRVMIMHGTPLVRAGLEAALQAERDLEIVSSPEIGAAPTAADLPAASVIVADYDLGVQLAASARPGEYGALIVTGDDRESSICAAIEAGVRGYLLLGSPLDAIVRAVRCVHSGGAAIDPVVAGKLIDGSSGDPLTARETEVLRLLMSGLRNKDIARRLAISEGTVKTHVKGVFKKLGAVSRTHVVAIARQRGLVNELELSTMRRRRHVETSVRLDSPRKGTGHARLLRQSG
jgi:DNA-binding NarL/FixJ family response regulator